MLSLHKGSTHESMGSYRHKFLLLSGAFVVSIALVLVKAYAVQETHSVGILSSLLDSSLDMLMSLGNMIAVYFAAKPADLEHRFGHGKIESVAALLQSIVIIGSALYVFVCAGYNLYAHASVEQPLEGVWAMVISTLLTAGVVGLLSYGSKSHNSPALHVEALHYKGDLLLNIGVLVSLYMVHVTRWYGWDSICALGISLYTAYSGYKIGKKAFHILIDAEFAADDRVYIEKVIRSHSLVRGLHQLRTRSSVFRCFIQGHVEFPGELTLAQTHAACEEIEATLMQRFPNAEVLFHQDPSDLHEPHRNLL